MTAKRTDTERLDWLEKEREGFGVISDDAGHWAVPESGTQAVVGGEPIDLESCFFTPAKRWRRSIRAAIDNAMPRSASVNTCRASASSSVSCRCFFEDFDLPEDVVQKPQKLSPSWQSPMRCSDDGVIAIVAGYSMCTAHAFAAKEVLLSVSRGKYPLDDIFSLAEAITRWDMGRML